MLTPARRYATAQLSREDVEQLALTTRPVRRLVAGDYWMSRSGAAQLLGISGKRVQQLTEADRLPYVIHRDGWRLYRRAQLEVVGNARGTRFGCQTSVGSGKEAAVGTAPSWDDCAVEAKDDGETGGGSTGSRMRGGAADHALRCWSTSP